MERGFSVYKAIELQGWRSMKSPHHMRHADCFRKGNRRAFIEHDRSTGTAFYFAVEGWCLSLICNR